MLKGTLSLILPKPSRAFWASASKPRVRNFASSLEFTAIATDFKRRKTVTKENLTQITIVLDRSGSMASVREATIAGFNEFVEGQKAVPGDANLTLIQFDTENAYEVVFDRALRDVPKLTAETYNPRGGTPLHDALGKTISELGTKLSKMPEQERPGKVVVVTMTDGLENASQNFTASQIADMIKQQHEVYKWEFLFLGANQDAILTGERLNIPRANSVTYAACAAGTENVMQATALNVASFRKTGSHAGLNYTEVQRKAAIEGIGEKEKGACATSIAGTNPNALTGLTRKHGFVT
jgi:Mg-chelatase subunit ChlD